MWVCARGEPAILGEPPLTSLPSREGAPASCLSPFLNASHCHRSEVAEGGKRKPHTVKAEACVWHAFFPDAGMRSCSLDVTEKAPSTSAGLLNSIPSKVNDVSRSAHCTLFKIQLNL